MLVMLQRVGPAQARLRVLSGFKTTQASCRTNRTEVAKAPAGPEEPSRRRDGASL